MTPSTVELGYTTSICVTPVYIVKHLWY